MVRYQQVYNKISCYGGRVDREHEIRWESAFDQWWVSPCLKVETQPKVNAEMASQMALRAIAKEYNLKTTDLTISKPELSIFDERLIQDNAIQAAHLVWRMEVTHPLLRLFANWYW